MAFPLKQVRTLEERLPIIEEVERKPSEKKTDVAKQLSLPPSTLSTIIAKKKIREHIYVSVDQELATYGVLCVWKKCVVSWEVEVVWRRCKAVVVTMTKPGFTEALCVFESMRVFLYAHDITERNQANSVNIESLVFKLKKKDTTKQMKINDFLKKK
jgi:hypothetical protein